MRFTILVVALLMLASGAHCQTLTGPIQEYGRKVNGDFMVSNDGLHTLHVVIKPEAFTLVNSKAVYTPIESTMKLTVKQPEFSIGAKQEHIVSFKGECLQLPCAVKLFAEFTDPSQTGIKTVIRIPCVVYSCDSQKLCRKKMLASWGVQ